MDENPYQAPRIAEKLSKKAPRWLVNAGWTALGALAGLAMIVVALIALIVVALVRGLNR